MRRIQPITMETKTQALQTVNHGMSVAAVAQSGGDAVAAIDRLGEWFAKSGLFGCNSEAAGKIVALTCVSEGMTPNEFARTYDIVFGKLRKKSMAAFAEFRRAGGRVKWIDTGDDGKKASAEFTFEGQTITLSYTIEEAAKAGLTKKDSGWDKNPPNMLRARVISNALGMLCPEIYAGEYDYEQAAGPSINLEPEKPAQATVAPSTPPPRETKPTVVEAEIVSEKVTPPPAAPTPTSQELPIDLQEQLLAVVGPEPESMSKAVAFCRAQKWIGASDGLEMLSPAKAREIIARKDHFRQKVLGIGGGK